MGTCYIVSYKEYSQKAGKYHGYPWVWKGHAKFRGRLPNDERAFHMWLMGLLRPFGVTHGVFKVIRHQAHGESPGFKCVAYGAFDEDHVKIERFTERLSGDEHKAYPNIPWSREPWYQSERHGFTRSRFQGTGKRWGPKGESH